MRLSVDFIPEDDMRCAQLHLHQEGFAGFKLPLPFLPELLQVLENPQDSEVLYFWQNCGVRHTRKGCTFHVSTIGQPLLQLSTEQCAKLVALFKSTYKQYL